MPCDHEAVLQALAKDAQRPPSEARLASLDATISQFASSEALADKKIVARALHDKVRALFDLQRPAEGARVLAELRARYATAEPELRQWVCHAHFGAALGLKDAHKRIDAYAVILEIASVEPAIDHLAAEALYNMGLCGRYLQPSDPLCVRSNDALRELERRFLASQQPRVAAWVAAGLAVLAGRSWPESQEAAEIYERVVDAYGSATEELQQHAVAALSDWGLRLMRRKLELAVEVWDRSWARFRHLKTPAAQARLAGDRLNRAVALGTLQGVEAELAAYEELHRTFFDSPWPAVHRWVVAAAENHALVLRDEQRIEEATRALERALDRFAPATEPAELVQVVSKAQRLLAKLRES